MSPDPYISIHMYLRILCEIHVSGFMSQHPHVSQEPLLDPCLRIRISASICISGSSARSMSPIHVSASLYLRVLCKIHVFGLMSQHLPISGFSARSMCPIHVLAFMSQHPFISQDPLQDPCLDSCLSIFVSQEPLQDPCLRINVSASTSMDPLQDPRLWAHVSASICISGTSARSMSPEPYISIHIYLRILCKIHVSGFMSQRPYISQEPLQDPCLRIRT